MLNLRGLWRRGISRWVAIALATALAMTMISAGMASSQEKATFDLDHGNALTGVIYPHFQKAVRTVTPDGSDATMVADHILMTEVSWFDAIAPYHPTAVGIYSNLGRRPKSEETTRNRNIAVIYAAYTSLNHSFPQFASDFRDMMATAGLDPGDAKPNTTTPAGIGTMAAQKVIAARKHDGSNRDGDEGGRKYNRVPYADYTGWKPVNTAYELRDPSHWQPNIVGKNGIFKIQQFVTPQYGRVTPISYKSPSQFSLTPPVNSDVHNRAAYKKQADEILSASAHLTDHDKMTAEFFNDKINALGYTTGNWVFNAYHFDIEKSVEFVAAVDIAIFDAAIASWYFKRKYDSVRPFSAIRYLYGNKKVTAWGGPGKGTVSDITGNEWTSYLPVADHPEYPSTSAAFCLAYTSAARDFLGSDKIDISVTKAKGSSFVEPGITPAKDVTLHWSSWTQLANDCRMSRVLGGVHFRSAVINAAQYAPRIGDMANSLIQRKLKGD